MSEPEDFNAWFMRMLTTWAKESLGLSYEETVRLMEEAEVERTRREVAGAATLVDSREGMQMLADWARAHGAVLNESHERLAKKHGVSLEGVTISRPVPLESERLTFRK